MHKYKNLTIIGTSHISIESINEVKNFLISKKPKIIALELDKARFIALTQKKEKNNISDIKYIGLKGYFFNLLGSYIEKKLGRLVGVAPGTEMKTAIKIAKKIKSRISLIDQDIRITLKKLSKEITWKEKFNFIADIIKGIFKKQKIKIDLTKVPNEEFIKKLLKQVKDRYPSFYKVLIKERDLIMAKNLNTLINNYRR
jgi:pheromone shutdown protein TraB